MEHAAENFGTIPTKSLEEFLLKIREVEDVEQVYLSSLYKRRQVIITFLTGEDYREQSSGIEKAVQILPNIDFRVFNLSYAQQELEKGNLYFIKNCLLGKLLYNSGNNEPFLVKKKEKVEILLKKGMTNVEEEIDRINSFTEGIKFYKKRKIWTGAAFLIHQKLEWLYRCLETFTMGKPLICHSLKAHLKYAHPFIFDAGPIINTRRRVEVHLLEVLDRAYSESRYDAAFDITKRETKILEERACLMENQVREILSFRVKSCYDLLGKEPEDYDDLVSVVEEGLTGDDEEKDLGVMKEIIFQELKPVKIISFGKRSGFRERQSLAGMHEVLSFTHYDLLVVTKETANIYPNKISNQITQKTDGKLATTIILTSSKKVEQALQKGNEFVHRVLTSGTVIFSNPDFSFDAPVPYTVTAEKLEKMNRDFFIRNHRASCFLAAADHVSGDDDATEISLLYHALQQICLGIIYVMLGLRPDCLKLEYLFDLCSNFCNVPDDCFPRWSPQDQRLFKKLINSSNEVRFRTSDRRSFVDADILFSRSENFLKEMEAIAEKRMEELKTEFQNEKP